jgi:pimeloyl-ACP methyl ester carboxylesterase
VGGAARHHPGWHRPGSPQAHTPAGARLAQTAATAGAINSNASYLHDFLTQNAALAGKPIILAGHSYGGAVITNAAVGDPEVRALVYVDAFIPDQGETLGGLLASVPGSCLAGNPADIFNLVPYPGSPPGDIDTYIKPSLVPGCFACGLPASQAAVIAATQRPLAASTLSEPSGTPAWKTIPSWAMIGTVDKVIPPACCYPWPSAPGPASPRSTPATCP